MNIGMILDNEFNDDLRVKNEVMALQTEGHNVFVLCYNHGKRKSCEKFHGATIIRISISKNIKNKLKFLNNTIFDIYSILWTYKIIPFARKNNIEVLHAHDLYMAKSVIDANKKLKIHTVLDLHENYPATLASYSWSKSLLGKLLVSSKRWERKEKKYLPKFTSIILLSDHFKEILTIKYQTLRNRFHVFPNYPNVDHLLSFDVNKNILDKRNDFIIFYFGGIAIRRGIFTLLEALKLLLRKSKSFKVLLIGPVDKADMSTLNSYLGSAELKDHIIHYKWKDIKFLPSYINISDVCVSPLIKNEQHESGIANKVFQYMLFKKPLIVSNCGPQQKIIEEEKCGLVFKSEDPKDLANQIEVLSKNSILRNEMGENGFKAVSEKYNLRISKEKLINMYRSINNIKL